MFWTPNVSRAEGVSHRWGDPEGSTFTLNHGKVDALHWGDLGALETRWRPSKVVGLEMISPFDL